jgi:predicted nucleotidyltransferase
MVFRAERSSSLKQVFSLCSMRYALCDKSDPMNPTNSKPDLISYLQEFFKENSRLFNLEMVFIYGSWVKGFPRKDSDVDLAVVFSDDSLKDEEVFIIMTEISYLLSLSLKREVNLIQIHLDFHKPMLYYNAIVLGIPIYIRNWDNFLTIRNEALFQMEDFSLFGLEWQAVVARKNLEVIKNA